jgi:uncharacterized protein
VTPSLLVPVAVPAATSSYLLVVAASFTAGVINAMAGGGSFLTFPSLLAVHLPPVNANATSTVALWPGQIASLIAFRKELQSIRHYLLPASVASAIGGTAGAIALLFTSQRTFLKLVPWLLLFATVLFAVSGPLGKWLNARRTKQKGTTGKELGFSLALFFWLCFVTFYIGYFGAGAGFLCIALFSLFGLTHLSQINALKVTCMSVANGLAVITFLLAQAVYWKECLLMMVAAILGSYLGAHYSRKLNPAVLRGLIIGIGLFLSIYYFVRY